MLDRSGAVVGVVSEGDFLRRDEIGTPRTRNRLLRLLFGRGAAAEDYVREHGRRVSEIMTLHPVTINEDAPLSEIVSVMEQNHIKRLPVVRDGKLVGIVSRSNLLQAVAGVAGLVPHPTVDDDKIRDRIMSEVAKHDWRPIGFNVIVRDGIVHLSGAITSERYRKAVIVAAENAEGVVKVHDHLFWTDPMTGGYLPSLEDEQWARTN